jgi:gliding motility-associated-like protein
VIAGPINGATGTIKYSWVNASGTVVGTTAVVGNLPAGTYTLTVTDDCDTKSNTVTIGQGPNTLNAVSSITDASCVAATGSINLTVTGGTSPYSFAWTGPNGFTSTTEDPTGLAAGVYNVTVTDNSGCTTTATATVAQSGSTIQATATPVNASCGPTGSVTLTVQGGNAPLTYLWNNGATSQNLTNVAAGTYTVTVTDAAGCTGTASATVTTTASTLTLGPSTKTDASCGPTGSVIAGPINGATGTIKYSWVNATGTVVGTTAVVGNLGAGTYTLTVTDDCDTKSNSVTIATTASTLTLGPSTKTDAACGPTGSVIAGPINGATGTIKYSWGNASGTVVGTTAVVGNLPAGTYTVTVTDDCGSQSNTVAIEMSSSTVAVSINTINTSCGLTNGSIAVTPIKGTEPFTFNLNGGSFGNTNQFSNLPAGEYIITAKDANGCTTKTTATINSSQGFKISLTPDRTTVFAGSFVNLHTTSNTSYNVRSWIPSNLLTNQTATKQTFRADTSTSVTVVAKSDAGCIDTATVFIKVQEINSGDVFVPNAFSPNADGSNDVLYVLGSNILEIDFKIYNRWGEQVYATRDKLSGWNGIFKNKPQPSDVYLYTLTALMENGSVIYKKGNVLLLR